MPDVPHPDALPSEAEIKQKILPQLPEAVRRYYERERPIELRPVDFGRYAGNPQPDNRFNIWMRTTAALPDDPSIHRCALAYASDMTILDTALPPHRRSTSTATSWARASTTRCGFTGRFAPTNGCFTARTALNSTAPAASAGARIYAADGTLVHGRREGLMQGARPNRPHLNCPGCELLPSDKATNPA